MERWIHSILFIHIKNKIPLPKLGGTNIIGNFACCLIKIHCTYFNMYMYILGIIYIYCLNYTVTVVVSKQYGNTVNVVHPTKIHFPPHSFWYRVSTYIIHLRPCCRISINCKTSVMIRFVPCGLWCDFLER